ncbi:helix-turn-helix transcriptional regulator [Waltera intestinalis]|nr:WYL domain-containing protein [Waltera intestinalis]
MAEEKTKQDKKGRLLALRDYLYKYTDEQHPVSTQELIDEMTRQGYPGNRKTIKDDIDVLNKFGMDIITNVSRGNSFYMASREFEIPELKLLVDAVSSSRFISAARSEQLIGKLTAMASEYEKEQITPRIFTGDRIKANNPHLYYVVDMLIQAIQNKKKVRFQYGEFDADKHKVLRNDGEIYINSPYGCLWNDDFYYLVGYSEKREKVVTFRVDRIVDLEIMDDDIIPEPADFDMSDYAKIVIEMFDGEPQEVELLCDNELMKSVIDKFGENIKTERVSDEQFKAVVNVSTSKTFYAWCFRFAEQMKIVGPENVKNTYIEMARSVIG